MGSPDDLYLGRSGLVWYAKLDQTSGTTATDSKGNSNGTYNGSMVLADTVGGVPGSKAPRFDGSNDDISVPDVNALDVADLFTVSVWVKLAVAGGAGQMALVTKNANAWQLAYDRVNTRFCMNVDSQGGDLVFSNSITDTAGWHHVMMTKNGSTRAIYIDGVAQTNLGTNVASQSNAFEMRVGSNQGVNSWFNGWLQHLAIYNVALSATDARLDYEQGLYRPRAPALAYAPLIPV